MRNRNFVKNMIGVVVGSATGVYVSQLVVTNTYLFELGITSVIIVVGAFLGYLLSNEIK